MNWIELYLLSIQVSTYAKQTLALLSSPRRTTVLSSAPRLASAILRMSYKCSKAEKKLVEKLGMVPWKAAIEGEIS